MLKADLLIHPVRMRMIIALSGRRLTAKQLAAELKDVASATLYHHLGLLAKAGIVQVVEERLVRGTLHEKVYTLTDASTILIPEDLAEASKDELLRYFFIFISKLLGDYSRYLQENERDDYHNAGYRQVPFYLNDEEFAQCTRDVNAALLPWFKNEPAPGRRRRILTTIVLPEHPGDTTTENAEQDIPAPESAQ